MASSKAKTVAAYLKELSPDVRRSIATVREMIVAHLPAGYVETMNWGMIVYEIPLAVYPKTYNDQPLGYVALAAQRRYNSLYLATECRCVGPAATVAVAVEQAFKAAGKKLDMGKCCIRFKTPDDLPLAELGKIIAMTPPAEFIRHYERTRGKEKDGSDRRVNRSYERGRTRLKSRAA